MLGCWQLLLLLVLVRSCCFAMSMHCQSLGQLSSSSSFHHRCPFVVFTGQ